MGLLERIGRVIRANLNSWVDKLEDPEKILEQTVLDMQDDLIKVRQAVAQAIAIQKRTERQQAQADSQAQEWYRRAQLALNQGDEELARQALTRRQSYLDTATAMAAQLQQQAGIVTQLKQNMRQLELKISDARTKKELYIARARSAQASQQVNDLLGGLNSNGALQAFERMEDKVLQLEAQAEASAELNALDLRSRIAALGEADEVEAELAALKAQVGKAQLSPQPQVKPLPQRRAIDSEAN
jgi:phage shock protein A